LKILIFGAGVNGKACLKHFGESGENEIVGFLDNTVEEPVPFGCRIVLVYKPQAVSDLDYDMILISNNFRVYVEDIKKQLVELGVPKDKISVLIENESLWIKVRSQYNIYDENSDQRVIWTRSYADYVKEHRLKGDVAECGVCMGDFSYYINKYFPDRKLYLFDTFSGFADNDIQAERELSEFEFINGKFNNHIVFSNASEHIVRERMLYKDKCIIKKGYFPKTAYDVEGQFCFVNLDMDLYQPMLAGLEFFYDKMCDGGVILLHDYFSYELPGVRHAVEVFERKLNRKLCKVTIGDFCSIAIIKYP